MKFKNYLAIQNESSDTKHTQFKSFEGSVFEQKN